MKSLFKKITTQKITTQTAWSSKLKIACAVVGLLTFPIFIFASPSIFSRQDRNLKISRPEQCGDLLATLVDKPPKLNFLSCQEPRPSQVRKLVAKYQVAGKDAALIELFLQKNFRMAPLKFVCCGWVPRIVQQNRSQYGLGHYRDSQGYNYGISMSSEETAYTQRRDWAKIPFFYVEVTKYLQEP